MRSKRTTAKLKGGQMDFFLPLKVGTGRATKRAHGFPKWAQRELAQEKRKRNRKGHSESSVSGRFEGGGAGAPRAAAPVLRGRWRGPAGRSDGGGAALSEGGGAALGRRSLGGRSAALGGRLLSSPASFPFHPGHGHRADFVKVLHRR
ncbi:hypothetical protein BS78_08G028000 [Paspalum vaginatum]|nr:hypothetical protein BS78_08G028000 [Paspalum vaginatum]